MKVSIVKCETYQQENVDMAVKEALDLISFKFKKGMKVLLKPNVLYAAPPEKAVTTHPSILIALCKLLKDCEIYIGDSPGFANRDEAFKVSKVLDVAKDFKANFVNFNTTELIAFKNEKNIFLKEVYLPKLIEEVDLIINLPKLKTHGLMKYTGAIKNLYGLVPGGKKAYYHLIADNEEKFGRLLVELHQYIKPELTIMDAVVVVLDATKNPYSQVNITIIGNLAARNIPVLVVANKMDLRKANLKKVEASFPQYKVLGISALKGYNFDDFYDAIYKLVK